MENKHTSETVQVIGHHDSDVELLFLGLRQTIGARDVVQNSQVLGLALVSAMARTTGRLTYLGDLVGIAALIKITDVRASTVCVDLVDGHSNLTTSSDLGNSAGRESILCVLTNVDVTGQLGSAALVDDIGFNLGVANQGRVLLARVDGCAVAGDLGIH